MSFPYTHLTAYVNDMGMSDMAASETIGLAGLLSLPGSLAFGFLGDRIGRPRLLATAYALRAITYLILLRANSPGILLMAGITLGLSWGATTSLTSAIVADVFGQRSVATIVGTMIMLMYLASGTYSYLAGLDYSVLGSYTLALAFAASLATLGCVSCLLVRAPRPAPREATAAATM
jgi:MFS family permease